MTKSIDLIKTALEDDGFIVIKRLGQEKFHELSEKLGHILYTTDIKLNKDKSNVVYNPQEILFHTDYPKAQIVSWVCLESNNNEAPLELLDTNNFSSLKQDTLDVLKKIDILFKCKLTSNIYSTPLISQKGSKIGTTYNPWGLQGDSVETQLSLFYKYLENCKQYSISLDKDDALFIDNHRLLHGRKNISPQSKRHLIRHFIKTKDLEKLIKIGHISE